jgi:uncharacterized protein YbjT (DUF2867 family)
MAGSDSILVTGANGHLGRQLIAALAKTTSGGAQSLGLPRALVRSERAAATLSNNADVITDVITDDNTQANTDAYTDDVSTVAPSSLDIRVCEYTDVDALTEAAAGCAAIVHLVGIIKENRGASYQDAHERVCRALASAAAEAGVGHIVYLSIVGSRPTSPNACLASKGRAEAILTGGPVPTTVIRVPMVLGPEDFASASLRADARKRVVPMIRGGATMQQPIDSGDVISAIITALGWSEPKSRSLDLAGPE